MKINNGAMSPDLACRLPIMEDANPQAGHFVKVVPAEYQQTQVHHGLYLPVGWTAGRKYPVIVEYPGNSYGSVCSGKIEDCKLGYYASDGKEYIWIVLPFVNEVNKTNQLTWWGDIAATVNYCELNVRRTCETYGGDTSAVLLTGFSRGAIACGYIGLHNDSIASLWAGFIAYAHFDGGSFTRDGAVQRLQRVQRRPVLIIYGENDAPGKLNSLAGAEILKDLGEHPRILEIPHIGHTDLWIETQSAPRDEIRAWMADVVKTRVKSRCGAVV